MDEILFADEEKPENQYSVENKCWKIIIVDDEKEIHSVTKMVLSGVTFEKQKIEFLSAYSGEEAKKIIRDNPDAALILLDVVMEKDKSGLEVVKYIRNELRNTSLRIILRTGQPGQAPERRVITEYDINDYKEKTELTSQKLYTTVIAALRSFKDLKTIESSKKGLEKIISSSTNLLTADKSLENFLQAVLQQMYSLLSINDSFIYFTNSSFAAINNNGDYEIILGTGTFKEAVKKPLDIVISHEIRKKIDLVLAREESMFFDDEFIGYFKSKSETENIVYLKADHKLSDIDKDLIKIFTTNITASFDNLMMKLEIINTQKEILLRLGEIIETRSKETANHVKRVAEYSRLMAEKLNLDEKDIELIKLASPMHDVGKIGINDAILNKPAKLTDSEFEEIKKHCEVGYDIFKASDRKILASAAQIAYEHHERWDGKGYPRGLKGKEISIFGRITAIADVFDALVHKRVYKDAWPLEDVLNLIKNGRGTQFDPEIVDVFLENFDEIVKIKEIYPDESKY